MRLISLGSLAHSWTRRMWTGSGAITVVSPPVLLGLFLTFGLSIAVFAQGTYPVLENTNLTLGIRYTGTRSIISAQPTLMART